MNMDQMLSKIKMKRPLTKTEKVLIFILALLITILVAFKLIIIPQVSKYEKLIEQKQKYEDQIFQMNTLLKNEKRIDREHMNLDIEKTILGNKYFSTIDQPQIINLLNDILNDEQIDTLNIHFNRPNEEQIGDLMVKTMNLTLPYRGDFECLIRIIEGIDSSPKKISVSNLIMDRNIDGKLAGNITLKIYAIEGLRENLDEPSKLTRSIDEDKPNPFKAFAGYDEKANNDLEDITEDFSGFPAEDPIQDIGRSTLEPIDEKVSKESDNRKILEDFEGGDIYFIPSHRNIRGSISKSNNSKSNKHSLRLEYDILALEEENRAYIDLTDKDIVLRHPPSSIGLWVYSYSYSPATIGYRLKDQEGKKIDVELLRGIKWTGWQYIEAAPPQDISLYPLQLDRLYLELNQYKDDYGIILVDGLEAKYPKATKDMEEYSFYIVEPGDTLNKISIKNYGNSRKVDLIMKYNEIKSNKDIRTGKILVIPK